MIDPRFYALRGPVKARDLAGEASLRGDPDVEITGVAAFDSGAARDLVYFDGKGKAPATGASVVVAPVAASKRNPRKEPSANVMPDA